MVYDLSVPEPKDASTAFLIHVDRDRDVGGGSFDCLSRKFLMHDINSRSRVCPLELERESKGYFGFNY